MNAESVYTSGVPVPEKVLRELSKSVGRVLSRLAEKDSTIGVKQLHLVIDPVLETADIPDLESGHRAAASNALCAIVNYCQVSGADSDRCAVLDDSIWLKIFNIYLHRSGEAKGKSMRHILVTLTNAISKEQGPRALELRKQAAGTFLDIIRERQDRFKVKPALQGLAHLLLKNVISIAQLIQIYDEQNASLSSEPTTGASSQTLFTIFLGWVVHHETALSAGHLIRNFLIEARRLPEYSASTKSNSMLPLWIAPVVHTLHEWPERVLEFKTHVFPHCFLPNIEEYLRFLSVLGFATHIQAQGSLPAQLYRPDSHQQTLNNSEEFRILLAAIESGKELSVIRDLDERICNQIEVRDGALVLPDSIFGVWMSHADPEVRLAGMFLSIYSVSVTKPVNPGVLRALQQNLVHLHTDTDPYFRREVLGNTQRLFDRLRASTATAARAKSKAVAASPVRMSIPKSCYVKGAVLCKRLRQDPDLGPLAFVVWYLAFLEGELCPTASYQRRITALRALTIVLRSGLDPGVPHSALSKSAQGQLNWAHGVQIANCTLVRLLLDLVLDAFDDVRDTAVSCLQLCLKALPQDQREKDLAILPDFLKQAEDMMLLTGRADQADGVARAYGMIFSLASISFEGIGQSQFSTKARVFEHLTVQLQETLELAHRNLSEAVNGRPVHGTFAALTYIIDQPGFYTDLVKPSQDSTEKWGQLLDQIAVGVKSLWSCVYHVLCADAPEGHVPDEIEDEFSLDTKEILSYSWRGLKEASTLLRTVVTKAPIGHGNHDFLTPELFEQLGRLCFTQLLELRHRGAFSTVSQTFAAFCRRCVTSKIPALQALPEVWYQETLRSIQDKADAITRRSAGIPALMTALLAAEVQPGGDLFPRAMQDLTKEVLVEAKSANIEESRLPQVHALNCIKEIFTTSKLSVASEAYIGQGLELAARTLNSEIWPIRNCSLMLFKALIERLLGSDEAQDWKERERPKTSRFSYDVFPTLPKILSDLLDPNGPVKKSMGATPNSNSPFDLHGAEGVFPALQILRQARPPQPHLDDIQKAVKTLLSSPHWHLRDMAARTDVSMRPTSQLHGIVSTELRMLPKSTAEQHGVLLTIKYMLTRLLRDPLAFSTASFGALMEDLSRHAHSWCVSSDCPFVRSAFFDIVTVCGMTMLRRSDALSVLHGWRKLTESISIGPQYALDISDYSDNHLLQTSLATIFLIDRVILRDNSLGILVSEDYQGIEEALALLAANAQDTCCAALDTCGSIVTQVSSNGITIPISIVLAAVHKVILQASNVEVVSKAQTVLASALQDRQLRADFFSTIPSVPILLTLKILESQCLTGPPSNTQGALYLLGFFLDHAYQELISQRPTVLHAIARYIRLLRMTIIDTNPFDTRFAAIQSLSVISHIWTADPYSKSTHDVLLSLSLILYDLLSDDDDEIRNVAARTTNRFLHTQQSRSRNLNTVANTASKPPLPTSHALIIYLTTTFRRSPTFFQTALHRLLTPHPFDPKHMHTPASIPHFPETFSTTRKTTPTLFAPEKQNLYFDASLDSYQWTSVLVTLAAHQQHSSIPHLATWVLGALTHLAQTARTEGDGALGWASKSEVFELVGRVTGCAELALSALGESGGVQGTQDRITDAAEMRKNVLLALLEVVETGPGNGGSVHGLLIRKVEGVLEREVIKGLGRIWGRVGNMSVMGGQRAYKR